MTTTTKSNGYEDISETKPRVTTFEENGVRTTTRTTNLGADPNEKPKETVSVRTIQHPDATETITVTEKKLPPIRYTETITREKVPKKTTVPPQIQITRPTPVTDVSRPGTTIETYPPGDLPPGKPYTVVRRERVLEDPNAVLVPPVRSDRVIMTQGDRLPGTTIIRDSGSYVQVPATRTSRIVDVRQPTTPVIVDVATPPVMTRKTTRIINDTSQDTIIDDRRTLVNYQDDYKTTRRTGGRSEWCGNCGADCCGCGCFDDCCGSTGCCRTNSFAQRKDVVSYRTRVTKDGRRVRYRNADVPGYRCCNCCTGWCSRVCPCCACLEWFCACPCWLWLCCLIPLLLALLGLSIGLLTQLPAIKSNSNAASYNELHVTKSYNTVLTVLGQNAVCQPDRNYPGIPIYCDQTTTQFSVSATASSSTVYAVQVNESDHLDVDYFIVLGLLVFSALLQHFFQTIICSIFHGF